MRRRDSLAVESCGAFATTGATDGDCSLAQLGSRRFDARPISHLGGHRLTVAFLGQLGQVLNLARTGLGSGSK
jgi:hypothetical protein